MVPDINEIVKSPKALGVFVDIFESKTWDNELKPDDAHFLVKNTKFKTFLWIKSAKSSKSTQKFLIFSKSREFRHQKHQSQNLFADHFRNKYRINVIFLDYLVTMQNRKNARHEKKRQMRIVRPPHNSIDS